MKRLIICVFAMATLSVSASSVKNTVLPDTRPCPQWWKDAKFGIFSKKAGLSDEKDLIQRIAQGLYDTDDDQHQPQHKQRCG